MNTDETTDNGFEGAERFGRMWMDFAANMARAGLSFTPGETPPDMLRQIRDAFLNAMSAYSDEYMRSPEFLEAMRDSIKQSVEFRKQLNDFLGQAHHQFQGASRQDMDQIMAALMHIEQRTADTEDRLSKRVSDLGAQLTRLETQMGDAKAATRSRPAGKAARKKTAAARTSKSAAKKKTSTKKTSKKKGARS